MVSAPENAFESTPSLGSSHASNCCTRPLLEWSGVSAWGEHELSPCSNQQRISERDAQARQGVTGGRRAQMQATARSHRVSLLLQHMQHGGVLEPGAEVLQTVRRRAHLMIWKA